MSWNTMALEVASQCPVPFLHALNLVNRSWLDIQRQFLWSFLYGEAAIPSITPITSGTATTAVGSNQVTANATLTALLNALPILTAPTLQCFRVGTGTIYRIVGWNGTGAAVGGVPAFTLILDKLYADQITGVVGAGGFQIFTAYINTPTSDFVWWESVKDPVNGFFIGTTSTRETVDMIDPQRFQSGWPRAIIPYIINPTPGAFYGYPMCEIWPAPLNQQTLVGTYFRSGLPFATTNDGVIPPLGEDVVIELTKMYAYEWCIANPNSIPAGSAKGFSFLYSQSKLRVYGGPGKPGMIDDYIRKDEAFSHRMLIDAVEPQFLNALPWVSQKQLLGYFPT